MKTLFATATMLMIMSFLSSGMMAQSFINDTRFNKILVDNEEMTAIEVTFEPGKKTPMHTHPAHFIYALTPGKLLVTFEDGETLNYDLKAGDSGYFEAERPHQTVNTGKTTMKILLLEFKDKPYKM